MTELARLHLFGQVFLAGRHDPRRTIREAIEHPNNAGLRILAEIANLIKQDRAAARARQHRRGAIHPLKVRGRDNRERRSAAVAEIMDRAGNQAFACAAFARNQHRDIGIHHPRHQTVKRLHRRRAPHQRQVILHAHWLIGGFHGRFGAALYIQRAGGPFHQVRQIEGFGQVIIGVFFRRLNGRHNGVLRRNDDHRQAGTFLGDLRQGI